MTFAVGSLVKAREREWVVLPESSDDFLILRPLGGTDAELAGIDTGLEAVTHASFDLPQVSQLGDFRSSQLLRNAIRLGFRSSAGPFRSFGRIAVEPRPYQLVPLLVALKQDTVRMLIADDVGIGKTVEALLIARELLDRAEIQRFSVLCPPHLAEQWQEELREKFHIEAELVLSGTAKRLDRICGNRSVFDVFPFTIVSMDYIKSDSRRDDFIRACPEMVIVDEAHTCAALGQKGKSNTRQQRHQVIRALAKKEDRHVILVTATPHSGNEEGFRSLLALLNADFADLPDSLAVVSNLNSAICQNTLHHTWASDEAASGRHSARCCFHSTRRQMWNRWFVRNWDRIVCIAECQAKLNECNWTISGLRQKADALSLGMLSQHVQPVIRIVAKHRGSSSFNVQKESEAVAIQNRSTVSSTSSLTT